MVPSLLGAGDGLTAQYFGNDRVVWTGYLNIEVPGRYDFGITSDEDARLTIDNLVIVDRRADQPGAPKTGSAPMAAGSHRILLERAQVR